MFTAKHHFAVRRLAAAAQNKIPYGPHARSVNHGAKRSRNGGFRPDGSGAQASRPFLKKGPKNFSPAVAGLSCEVRDSTSKVFCFFFKKEGLFFPSAFRLQ
jgi:hypothetical protein